MIPLAPSFVIAAANALVGVGEEGGNNRGRMVDLFLREVDQPAGQPWCAAFVHHAGYWALYDPVAQRSSWPLPATASCWQLGDFARRQGILEHVPQFGDVFLQYRPELKRFAHTGFIERVLAVRRERRAAQGPGSDPNAEVERVVHTCRTIEGNTNAEGSREGDATQRRVREFCAEDGDRFVRWVELEQRKAA